MSLTEPVFIALASLRANLLRSLLTLLGIIIGVMSVITVLSFVEGLNRFVSEKLLNAGANVFWVDPYGFVTSQEAWELVKDNPPITLDDEGTMVFAIGVMLYQLATGELPFGEPATAGGLRQRLWMDPVPPRKRRTCSARRRPQ